MEPPAAGQEFCLITWPIYPPTRPRDFKFLIPAEENSPEVVCAVHLRSELRRYRTCECESLTLQLWLEVYRDRRCWKCVVKQDMAQRRIGIITDSRRLSISLIAQLPTSPGWKFSTYPVYHGFINTGAQFDVLFKVHISKIWARPQGGIALARQDWSFYDLRLHPSQVPETWSGKTRPWSFDNQAELTEVCMWPGHVLVEEESTT